MKRRLLFVLLSFLSTGLALGDKVILNDGTEIEGTVLAEQGDFYEVEVQVSATIKDVKLVKKADVKSIVRTSPEDIAFKAIEGLVPTPDRLSVADYDNLINRQVKAFTDAFPKTKYKRRVESILAILERERERAKVGGLKLDGEWITPDEREANAYEFDARFLYEDITAAAGDRARYKEALRNFERFEADFTASESYPKAVDAIKQVLIAYRPIVGSGVKRSDDLVVQRKTELERLPASQRAAALADIKRRSELYTKVLVQEKNRRTKWMTLEQYHKAPMEDALRNIQSEIKRLDALTIDESKLAGPVYRDAWVAAAAGDEENAQKAFSNLQSLRVPDRYIDTLKERLAKEIEEDSAAPPNPTDPTPEGADTPGTGEEPPGRESPDSTADGSEAEDSDSIVDTTPEAPSDDDEEGGSSLTSILMIVMVVVLLIAAVAVFTGGKKK
jgi:hypothetical protein